jgi:linoleoyl-CoA desaturase
MNSLSAYSLNMMGGNSHFWKLKHNISHHTFTNISGEDHDINLGVFLRLDVNQKRRWFHKYQHIYWIGLYAITYLAWVLFQDFQKYFTGRMAPGAAEKHTFALKEHLIFWVTKVLYLSVYIVVPVLIVGWMQTLVGFLVAGIVCGLFISIVFQMAHSVEIADFPMPDKDSNRIEVEWAIHQVNTTANFGTKSRMLSWMLGGLNYQVEHHLFPRISHVYYPSIQKLVKETCLENRVQYNEYPTLYHALKSHLARLKEMGRK